MLVAVVLGKKAGIDLKRIITYGTFDLIHYGHINLLRRARALGDYLIVACSTDDFNKEKKKEAYFSYEVRKSMLEAIRYVDLVIPEYSTHQKVDDCHKYEASVLVMGDDWQGVFDYVEDYGVECIYLPRTPEVSSSGIKLELQNQAIHQGEFWSRAAGGEGKNIRSEVVKAEIEAQKAKAGQADIGENNSPQGEK